MEQGGTTSRLTKGREAKTAQTITGPCKCGGLGKNSKGRTLKKQGDTVRLGYIFKHKNILKIRLAEAYAKHSI